MSNQFRVPSTRCGPRFEELQRLSPAGSVISWKIQVVSRFEFWFDPSKRQERPYAPCS